MRRSLWLLVCLLITPFVQAQGKGCVIGAFLSDRPTIKEIDSFQRDFGLKPGLVLVFVDWEHFVPPEVLQDIYAASARAVVTWEPWHAALKEPVDYDAILSGTDDDYLLEFANRLKALGHDVYVRWAHEMNGNWYPWGAALTPEKYIQVWRYVHKIFRQAGADNVRWVFAVNAENVPADNAFERYYPGEAYVDVIGIDGYNWGKARSWSRWRRFKDIFDPVYQAIVRRYPQPVMITEFSSTSQGGDKRAWIREALSYVKTLDRVTGLILFNLDKETDWSFPASSPAGKELKKQLKDPFYRGVR